MTEKPSLLSRLLGLVFGVAFLALAFVFSLVIFIVLLGVGLIALGYFWWKTRALRRAQAAAAEVIIESSGHYEVKDELPAIEGESRREKEAP